MIEVELPDGSILEIDTDDQNVALSAARNYLKNSSESTQDPPPASVNNQQALQQQQTTQGPGAVDYAAEVSGGMQRGALGMLDMLTTTPYNFVAKKIGATQAQPFEDMVRGATDGALAPEKGAFAGEGVGTDIASSAGELATVGGLASKGLGMAANVMKPSTIQGVTRTLAGPNVASETLAGAASGVGAESLGEVGGMFGATGRMVGEVAGGMLAPMALPKNIMVDTDIVEPLLSGDPKALAKAADLDHDFIRAAEEEGVSADVLLGMASRNQSFNTTEGALSALPGTKLQDSKINVAEKLRGSTRQLIKDMGGFDNPGEMSDFYRKSVDTAIKDLEETSSALYNEAYEVVPRGTKLQPENLSSMLKQEISDLGGDLSSMPAEFREALKKLMPGDTSTRVNPLTLKTESMQELPTYHAFDTFRKNLGDATRGKGPYKDMQTGMAKRLYGALRKDQDSFLSNGYPAEFAKIKKADLLVQERKAAEEATQAIMGKELAKDMMPTMVSLTKGMASGKKGLEEFRRFMRRIPEDMRPATIGTAIGEMAKGSALNQRDFSANQLGRVYQDLMNNKSAQKEMKAHMSEAQWHRFANVGKLSEGLARVNQNTVKTGASATVMQNLDANKNLIERVLPKILGSWYVEKAMSPFFMAGMGRSLARVIDQGTDRAKRANDLLSDPHFRLKVFSEYEKMLKGGKIDPNVKQTARVKTWISGLPKRDQATINRIGIMPFLLQDEQ